MPERTLKPEEVANLDPYKRRQGRVTSKAEGLLTGAGPIPEASEDLVGEIQRFSPEARKALEKDGYEIHELTGQSIVSLRDQGNKFWSDWHKRYPDLETLPSIKSEVATLHALFLPKSNKKTLSEQEEAVSKFNTYISSKISGVKAVIGEVPDYAELAFKSPSDRRLFGEKYGYGYTKTQTEVGVGSRVAIVGCFYPGGLLVATERTENRHGSIFVAPLVVPF